MSEIQLNDEECVLIEFCNESKQPVQVGFQAWLTDKNNILNNINNEVIIKWPLNIDIVCAKSMQRQINKKKESLKWKTLVVKILAIGEWTEMCKQAKNIERFGVANPTKENRHYLCKKKDSSDDERTSSDDLLTISPEKKRKRHIKQENMPLISNTSHKKEKAFDKNNKTKEVKQKVALNINSDILQKISNSASAYVISDIELSDDNDKIERPNLSTLKEENARLRAENLKLLNLQCRCRTLLNDNLNKMQNVSAAILENMYKVQEEMNKLPALKSTVKVPSNHIDINNKYNTDNNNKDVPGTLHNTVILNDIKEELIHSDSTNVHSEKNTNSQLPTINFGGRYIDAERIKRINASKGISAYTSALMNVVFTTEEMATSTLTGTISNFCKNKNENKKRELAPVIRDSVIDFIMEKFKITEKSGTEYIKIKNSMKVKLNNEASTMKKKTVGSIESHLQQF